MKNLPENYAQLSQLQLEQARLHIEFLEKINNQIGLLTNPYAIMVGVLSVLFTAAAVIGAYILFKQKAVITKKIYKKKRKSEIKNLGKF